MQTNLIGVQYHIHNRIHDVPMYVHVNITDILMQDWKANPE